MKDSSCHPQRPKIKLHLIAPLKKACLGNGNFILMSSEHRMQHWANDVTWRLLSYRPYPGCCTPGSNSKKNCSMAGQDPASLCFFCNHLGAHMQTQMHLMTIPKLKSFQIWVFHIWRTSWLACFFFPEHFLCAATHPQLWSCQNPAEAFAGQVKHQHCSLSSGQLSYQPN